MATWYDDTAGKPSQNPLGGQLSAEQVQLKRVNPFGVDIMGIFNQAFEKVKAQPAEAIGYPLVIMAIQMAVHMAINIIMQFAMFFVAFAAKHVAKQPPEASRRLRRARRARGRSCIAAIHCSDACPHHGLRFLRRQLVQ